MTGMKRYLFEVRVVTASEFSQLDLEVAIALGEQQLPAFRPVLEVEVDLLEVQEDWT